jgi:Fur family zinc uptake transcriptional regulator
LLLSADPAPRIEVQAITNAEQLIAPHSSRFEAAMQPKASGPTPRLTRNQFLVLSVLEGAEAPLSAYSILDRLRSHGLKAPLQVYRALDKLLDFGKIRRVESMNAFVVCQHADRDCLHPAITGFKICDLCGAVEEFHDENVERALIKHVRSDGFRIKRTAIEIHGTCSSCR